MSQRNSGYDRIDRDAYITPAWVTEALLPYLPTDVEDIWECACGTGAMVEVLRKAGYRVKATDIATGTNFLTSRERADWIVTNSPYTHAQEFIEHALDQARDGVAMLLPTDYDHAKGRVHLFAACPQFAAKIVLTTRIRWFAKRPGDKSPSTNHCWMIWRQRHTGPPHIFYSLHSPRLAAPE